MDAEGNWENFFDSVFFGQLNFKPNLFDRPGNYRIYGWLNDKDHIKIPKYMREVLISLLSTLGVRVFSLQEVSGEEVRIPLLLLSAR